jgi:hypothetical protein
VTIVLPAKTAGAQILTPTIPNAILCFGINGHGTHNRKYTIRAVMVELRNYEALPFIAEPITR